ncbi:uncharacterized protein [Dermacentor albipictus]|uniref:uncharacterized protein isoform X5 n=1 Tax=Dermacentor albipictus TaxID=60249 RepID=UPI0038FD2D52
MSRCCTCRSLVPENLPSASCCECHVCNAASLQSSTLSRARHHDSLLYHYLSEGLTRSAVGQVLHPFKVMQVVTAYQGSFDATCPVPDYTACKDCTCPPFIFTTLDFKSPLDMTALPGVVSLACWPPWSPSDKGLLKQPPQPTTPGSGAAMSAKHLRFVFLQKLLPRRRSCLKKLEFRSTLETTILPEKSLSQLQKCPVLAVALGTQSAMLGFATTVLPTNDLQSSGLDGTAHVDQCVITEINVARVKASAIAPKLVPSYHVNVREGIKGFDATTVTSGRVTGTSDMLTNPFRYAVQVGVHLLTQGYRCDDRLLVLRPCLPDIGDFFL